MIELFFITNGFFIAELYSNDEDSKYPFLAAQTDPDIGGESLRVFQGCQRN